MSDDDFTSRFILQHYYDLFDDAGGYEGIYICEECGRKTTWYQEGAPYFDVISCEYPSKTRRLRRCGGTMRLHVFTKNQAKEILNQE